jgi:hypothetical protein
MSFLHLEISSFFRSIYVFISRLKFRKINVYPKYGIVIPSLLLCGGKYRNYNFLLPFRSAVNSANSMDRWLSCDSDILWAGQKIPSFPYEAERFIAVFAVACRWTLSWVSSIRSVSSHLTSLKDRLQYYSLIHAYACEAVFSLLVFVLKCYKHLSPPCMIHGSAHLILLIWSL